jgi:hypothetical protein
MPGYSKKRGAHTKGAHKRGAHTKSGCTKRNGCTKRKGAHKLKRRRTMKKRGGMINLMDIKDRAKNAASKVGNLANKTFDNISNKTKEMSNVLYGGAKTVKKNKKGHCSSMPAHV